MSTLILSPNHLIVTSDDFGLAQEINQAVETAHRDGILTAASLMVAGPAARDAVGRALRLPRLHVGLHLVLVEGHPVLPPEKIPDLVGADGNFRTDMFHMGFEISLRPSVRRQLAAEIMAQFEAFLATGLKLDHVNAHKHFHLHPVIAKQVISIGLRYGMRALRVPFEPSAVLRLADKTTFAPFSVLLLPWQRSLRREAQRARLITPDAAFGMSWSGAMTATRLAALIANLPRGLIEIYMHPATSNVFAGQAAGYAYAEEFAALVSEPVRDALQHSEHCLGGYSDMKRTEFRASSSLPQPKERSSG